VDITMPQLGENVTSATITRWLKAVGEHVAADEPLYEVTTDKVDTEVPSAFAGVVAEILVSEGSTVPVGERIAVVTEDVATSAVGKATASPRASGEKAVDDGAAIEESAPVRGLVTSPVVRRLITQRGLEASEIVGTGEGGRITRHDVEAASPAPKKAVSEPTPRLERGDEVMALSNIRRITAEHTTRSKATSAHVYTSVEVDFEQVERTRTAHGEAFRESEGFSLTYLPFIARAVADALHEYPIVNSSLDADQMVVHQALHLSVAVDLDFAGLVAPVVRDADGKRLTQLAREIRDLGSRARAKRLKPDELAGGTFTITNMGPFETYMTLPIINQPQVAILATDGIRKRPVVVTDSDGGDAIAIHHVGILALTWDHRAFDGAYAAAFLHAVRTNIETRDWDPELA
jgi:pyruvate dehydrogenase E2 component (dihydrolipoamide acetyltransferase)